MAFERIELNICPTGDMPVFHCSQYDVGRPIIIDLKNGDDVFTPTAGTTFELHCRKVDDNIVTLSTYEVDGNTLTFTSTEQLCACPGDNLCEVAIYLDELCMGTLNFMLHVEPDPLAGGLESETQIYNLTEQIEEITEQVIGDNYYDKTEVDDLLDTKADKATTYTKTEVDTALNLKADKSDTYTKTETNNLLAGKADASDTYSKAQVDSKLSLKADKSTTYTKTQVDDALALKANSSDLATVATTGDYDDLLNKPTIPAAQVQSDYAQSDNTQVDYIKNKPDIEGMINNALLEVMPVDTASGPIASFNTELDAPLVNVSCNVVATGGNGTPDNPNPINGYSSANIARCGVNLMEEVFENGFIQPNGTEISSVGSLRSKNYNPCKAGVSIYMYSPNSDNNSLIAFYDNNKTYFDYFRLSPNGRLITIPNGASYFRIALFQYNGGVYDNAVSINYPSTDTTYHPYTGNTYTIAFGQMVYGGVLDVTRGKLHVTHGKYTLTDDSNLSRNSDHSFYFGATPAPKATGTAYYTGVMSDKFMPGETANQDVIFIHPNGLVRFNTANAYQSASDCFTAIGEITVVYPLATPFDIDLTPVQIRALVGENNVYSDTNGNTAVQFKDSIQHYIDTKVGS